VQRQLGHAERRDRGHRDTEPGHALQQVAAPRRIDLDHREPVGDVHPAGSHTVALHAIQDQVELGSPQLTGLVQVEVEPAAVFRDDREEPVELTDRVVIDQHRVQAADVLGSLRGRLLEELEHAGASQHAVLRERHDRELDGAVEARGGLADRVDAPETDTRIDVDVGAHARGARAQ